MTYKAFDFKRAWNEVAKPAFEDLPKEIHELYRRVHNEAADLAQDESLNMSWPAALQCEFESIDSGRLAAAAMVIHSYGHWHSNNPDFTGAHWKFSNYADQILRVRCGLPSRRLSAETRGYSFYICDGELRWAYSDPRTWTWHTIGLATPITLEIAKDWLAQHEPERNALRQAAGSKFEFDYKWFESNKESLANKCWPTIGFLPKYKDIGKTYVEE